MAYPNPPDFSSSTADAWFLIRGATAQSLIGSSAASQQYTADSLHNANVRLLAQGPAVDFLYWLGQAVDPQASASTAASDWRGWTLRVFDQLTAFLGRVQAARPNTVPADALRALQADRSVLQTSGAGRTITQSSLLLAIAAMMSEGHVAEFSFEDYEIPPDTRTPIAGQLNVPPDRTPAAWSIGVLPSTVVRTTGSGLLGGMSLGKLALVGAGTLVVLGGGLAAYQYFKKPAPSRHQLPAGKKPRASSGKKRRASSSKKRRRAA